MQAQVLTVTASVPGVQLCANEEVVLQEGRSATSARRCRTLERCQSRSGAASLSVGLVSCVLVMRIIVSVPFLSVRAQELCESRGGRVLRFLWT